MKNNKKIIFILLIFILLGAIFFSLKIIKNNKIEKEDVEVGIGGDAFKSGDYKFKIKQGDLERYYLLHVPESYKGKSSELVFAFHGGLGNADGMAKNYDWKEKADKEGFIVAFPNGTSRLESGERATWNAGECCGYASGKNSDDVGFVNLVIEDIKKKVSIGKIFATGMSNGGMFSYRLACEMSDTFSAIAAVAGTDNFINCNPKNPISIMHVHGLADSHVLFNGGAGPNSLAKVDYKSVPNTILKWRNRNKCEGHPKRILENRDKYCEVYSECKNDTQVKLCVVENGGHSWPGLKNSFGKNTSAQSFSATDEIWNFFSAN